MRRGVWRWVRNMPPAARLLLVGLACLLALVVPAEAARRALVIGIDGYADPLLLVPGQRTGEDAVQVARVLKEDARYETVTVMPRNANKVVFARTLAAFVKTIQRGDMVLVFYSGHGIEYQGGNYLLLADAPGRVADSDIEQRAVLEQTAVSQRGLLAQLQATNPSNIVLVINACRNELDTTATLALPGTDGQFDLSAPSNREAIVSGTMVIYATSSGLPAQVCLDGTCKADNNPMTVFTRRFVEALKAPNLAARDLADQVGKAVETDVRQATGEVQRVSVDDETPYDMKASLYLGPIEVAPAVVDDTTKKGGANDSNGSVADDPCVVGVERNLNGDELILADLGQVSSDCRKALVRQPNSAQFKELSGIVDEQVAAQRALTSDSRSIGKAYLRQYPKGRFVGDVTDHLAALTTEDDTPSQPSADPPAVQTQVDPPTAVPDQPVTPPVDPVALAKQVQTELNRVGCTVGTVDGVWGQRSRNALSQFADRRNVAVASLEPSSDILEQLLGVAVRVCPLACSITQVEKGGACVAKTCAAGQKLNSKGQCFTPEKTGSTTTKKSSGGGTTQSTPKPQSGPKCIVFRGTQICE